MLCQQCLQRDATIHMTEVVNNVKKDHYLCRTCAAVLKGEQEASGSPWSDLFESLLPGPSMFGYPLTGAERRVMHRRLICPKCGETERELRETGLLGCSQCYEIFHDLLIPVFRRAQGHTRHIQVSDATPLNLSDKSGQSEVRRYGVSQTPSAKHVQIAKDDTSRAAPGDGNGGPSSEIERLKSELQAAVSREDYKEAARLRDAIHKYKKDTSE